jgi:hypothetical protein
LKFEVPGTSLPEIIKGMKGMKGMKEIVYING